MSDDRMQEVSLRLDDWQGVPWRVEFSRRPDGLRCSITLPNGCEVARTTVGRTAREWLRAVLVED